MGLSVREVAVQETEKSRWKDSMRAGEQGTERCGVKRETAREESM